MGLTLTGVTALWSLRKIHLSQLSTGSTQEDLSLLNEILLMGRKESNQTKSTTWLWFNQILTKIGASVVNPQSIVKLLGGPDL